MTDIKGRYDSRWRAVESTTCESDNWDEEGESIFEEGTLNAIRQHLEDVGCIVVEHWHYRESRAPTRLVFDDFEEFGEHLQNETKPGDAVYVYAFPHEEKPIASGKCPDQQGRVPERGAY